jgi:hypothetical protein
VVSDNINPTFENYSDVEKYKSNLITNSGLKKQNSTITINFKNVFVDISKQPSLFKTLLKLNLIKYV